MSKPDAPTDPTAMLRQSLVAIKQLREKVDRLEKQRTEPIAIVGIGCRFPKADGVEQYWKLLREGIDAIDTVPPDRWNADEYFDGDPETPGKIASRFGGFLHNIDAFDADFFELAPREVELMDPQQRLVLETAWEALEHAGIAPSRLANTAAGVFLGVGGSDYLQLTREAADGDLDLYSITGVAPSVTVGRLSYLLGLQGPSIAIDTACSSSLVAVHLACGSLRTGESALALAGGVNVILRPSSSIALSKGRMLAPDGRCKTFDAAADGFVRAEGCGIVVLKRLGDAERDGDRILAVIRGSAVNQDGRSSGLTAPNGPSQENVIRRALEQAGVEPDQVSYIEAHGTATELGDPIEAIALGNVFGPSRPKEQPLKIGAVKTNLGHLEAAAGVAGLIKVALSLQHALIPPHLHLQNPSPHIPWAELPIEAPTLLSPWPTIGGRRIAGVSAFGLGGTNAHLILESAAEPKPLSPGGDESSPQLIVLSARSEEALRELAIGYSDWLRENPTASLGDIATTLAAGRSHFERRVAAVVGSADELAKLLAEISTGTVPIAAVHELPQVAFAFLCERLFVASAAVECYDSQPVFRDIVDRCSAALAGDISPSLADSLQTFENARIENAVLDALQYAVQVGYAALLKCVGVVPEIVAGAGVGEFVAGHVAGAFSLEDGVRLVFRRGKLTPQSKPDWESLARSIEYHVPATGLVNSFTGQLHPGDQPITATYWLSVGPETIASKIVLPVKGRAVCVEIGEVINACSDSQSGQLRRSAYLDAIAELYGAGVEIDFEAIFARAGSQKLALPTYPFQRRRYWIPVVDPDSKLSACVSGIDDIHAFVQSRLDETEPDAALEEHNRLLEQLDVLAAAYIRTAIAEPKGGTHGSITDCDEVADRLGVVAKQRRFFQRLVAILDAHSSEAIDPASLHARLCKQYPSGKIELELVARSGAKLRDLLQGCCNPLELLFPGDGSVGGEEMYRDSPGSIRLNTLARWALRRAVADRPPDRILRILEIGAGTGGTTSHLLPELPADRTDYVFTDASAAFFDRAQSLFAQYPFVSYRVLNAESAPADQGFACEQFDIVVAANVLHATRNVISAAENARSLLAPGGLLLLLEGLEPTAWVDMTFGAIEGWFRFEDGIRTDHPLLAADQWAGVLKDVGFEASLLLTSQYTRGHGVIVAKNSKTGGLRSSKASPSRPLERNVRIEDGTPLPKFTELSHEERVRSMENLVRGELTRILRLDADRPIDPNRGFFEMGMDSLMAVTLRNRLQKQLELLEPLPATTLFDHPTLPALVDFLLAAMRLSSPVAQRSMLQATNVAEPIAIVGIGCRFPGAEDVDAFWRLLADGRDAVGEVPADRWNVNDFFDADPEAPGKAYSRHGAFIHGIDRFDPLFFGITPREAVQMDPQQRLVLEVAWEALEDAGIAPDTLAGSRGGVYVGICTSDYAQMLLSQGAESIDAYLGMGIAHSVVAGRLSHFLGLEGPSLAVDTACSSGLVALHQACHSLRSGEAEFAIVAGVNAILSPTVSINLCKAKMLAADGRCKSFDAAADGFVRGEGCGVVVLKRLSEAERNGDRILAVIRGSAVNQDGRSGGLTVPNGPAQERVIRDALNMAKIEPAQVSYVEAHGTGTSLGDPIEVSALANVYGQGRSKDQPLFIGSVKTNIGHLEAAAGIAGLIKIVLSFEHGERPKSLHFENPSPHIAWSEIPIRVAAEPSAWEHTRGELRFAGVSSFGFSGTNAHVLVSEPASTESETSDELRPQLLVLSAKTPAALRDLASRHSLRLKSLNDQQWENYCFTLATGRAHFEHRLTLIVNGCTSAAEQLSLWLAGGVSSVETGFVEAPANEPIDNGLPLEMQARRYLLGGRPNPERSQVKARLRLPTYPFQRKRYWIDTAPAEWRRCIYETVWRECPCPDPVVQPTDGWIIVDSGSTFGDAFVSYLQSLGAAVRRIDGRENLCDGLRHLADELGRVSAVVCIIRPGDAAALATPLVLLQTLLASKSGDRLYLVTTAGQRVEAGDVVDPHSAAAWGFGRTVALEHPDLWGGVIDLPAENGETFISQAVAAIAARDGETQSAMRSSGRRVARLVQVASEKLDGGRWNLSGDRTYLVTGGLGAVGLHVAERLIQRGARRLVLVGRRSPNSDTLQKLDELRSQRVLLITESLDIAEPGAVAGLVERYPDIAGVVHCAGTLDDGVVANQTYERFRRVFAGKADGAWALHESLRNHPLDFFVMAGSMSSVFGSAGQANYAGANAYLDGLADHRRSLDLPATCVSFGPWAGSGMATRVDDRHGRSRWRSMGVEELSVATALDAMEHLSTGDAAHRCVLAADWSKVNAATAPTLVSELANRRSDRSTLGTLADELKRTPLDRQLAVVHRFVGATISAVLGLVEGELPLQTGLFELGMDSLMAVEIRNRLQRSLGIDIALSSTIALDYPTWEKLSDHLANLLLKTAKRQLGNDDSLSGVEPIAIVGMSGRFPGADNVNELWELLESGKDAIGEVPPDRWDSSTYFDPDPEAAGKMYTRWGGFVDGVDRFDPQFFGIAPREAEAMDPQHRLLLETTWEALEDAGIAADSLAGSRTGVFIGVSGSDHVQRLASIAANDAQANFGVGGAMSVAAGRISYTFGLEGPALVIDTACSSSLVAVHQACRSLHDGESELAIAGGVNLILNPLTSVVLCRARMLSPTGRCRTFDAEADGYVRSDGCAIVVLKRLSAAERDGDRILAVIRGSAVNQDGRSGGLTVPNGPAQERVIRAALRSAKVDPSDVSYIEAHGTGTRLGDPIEVQALANVFGVRSKDAPLRIGSVKSNLGHLEAAAGIAGLIKTVLSLRHKTLPASLHCSAPNPHVPWADLPVRVQTSAASWASIDERPRFAGVSSFGFSGTNAHIVVEEYVSASASEAGSGLRRELFVLSAKTDAALRALAAKYVDLLAKLDANAWSDTCYTLANGRARFVHRLALVAESGAVAAGELHAWLMNEPSGVCAGANSNAGDNQQVLESNGGLDGVARQFVDGSAVDLASLFSGRALQKRSLPSYPFQRKRCWLETIPADDGNRARLQPNASQPLAGSDLATTLRTVAAERRTDVALDWTRRTAAEVLGIEVSDLPDDGRFFDLGLDSLTALEIRNRLQKALGDEFAVSSTAALDYPTARRLAEYIHSVAFPRETRETVRTAEHSTLHGPIAILGMSGRFPGANDIESLWRLLRDGVDAIVEVPADRWDIERYYDPNPATAGTMYTRWGGFIADVDKFDAGFFGMTPREAAATDPQHRLLLETTWEALERAGIQPTGLAGSQTGVFIGISGSEYSQRISSIAADEIQGHFGIGGALSAAAGRISYALGLQGPSLAIDTACSSSLVAVHQACSSLWNGESELAIAGGVNLILSPLTNVTLCRAGMLAPDGRCKSFDASANGYVRSDGCGVVVLKRLSAAERDGDPILAVIRGSAVNQDGSSGGLTVPNGPAQEAVIRAALQMAGTAPNEIAYVEAHGTGTSLGDPIEVRALANVLGAGRSKEKPLVIGSVKSNLGHLEAAAGITGLIKVVLMFANQTISKSLHYRSPNPHIPWDEIPVRVASESSSWVSVDERQRCAGVSSFGFTGTNAHVVLEEYSHRETISPRNRRQPREVLVLSAKSAAALQRSALRYATLLRTLDADQWPDVCYTAATGRAALSHRLAVVASSPMEAAEELSAWTSGANSIVLAGKVVHTTNGTSSVDASSFESPQHFFAHLFTTGAAVDDAKMDFNGRKLLLPTYPFERERHWLETSSGAPAKSKADRQPLLGSRQVHPRTGEVSYSGSLNGTDYSFLRDHRVYETIVVPGATYAAMAFAAIGAPASLNHVEFHEAAAFDGSDDREFQILFESSNSASERRFEVYSRTLTADSVWRRHASGNIDNDPPRLEIAARSLDELREGMASRPTEELFQQFKSAGLDLGPAFRAIRNLWRGAGAALAELHQPGSVRDLNVPIHPAILDACTQVAGAIAEGAEDELGLSLPVHYERILLSKPAPARFFVHAQVRREATVVGTRTFDITLFDAAGQPFGAIIGFVVQRAPKNALLRNSNDEVDSLIYSLEWIAEPDPENIDATSEPNGRIWLAFFDDETAFSNFKQGATAGHRVIGVFPGNELRLLAPDRYCISPFDPRQFEGLFRQLRDNGASPHGVVFAWGSMDDGSDGGIEKLERSLAGVLHLAQALVRFESLPAAGLWLVADGANSIQGRERVLPASASLWAFGRSLIAEQPNLRCRLRDIDSFSAETCRIFWTELSSGSGDLEIACRGATRYSPRLRHWKAPSAISGKLALSPNGVHLVVGGLGALGLAAAEWLVDRGARRLVLIGRRGPSDDASSVILRLEERGCQIDVKTADIADAAQLRELVDETTLRLGPIRGVVHAAGIIDDGMIPEQTWQRLEAVLAAKTKGAWILHRLLADQPLELFLLYSSATSVFGSAGQSSYCAANGYLDGLAAYRRSLGLPALVVNWGPWRNSTMTNASSVRANLSRRAVRLLESQQAFNALDILLENNRSAGCVLSVDWQSFTDATGDRPPPMLRELVRDDRSDAVRRRWGERIRELPKSAQLEGVQAELTTTLLEVLGSKEKIDPQDGLFEIGMDSLSAVEFRNRLSQELGLDAPIPATVLFKHSTVKSLAKHVLCDVLKLESIADVENDSESSGVDQRRKAIDAMSDEEATHRLFEKLRSSNDNGK